MAASRGSAAGLAALVAILAVLLLSAPAAAEVVADRYPPLAPGLSFDFYKKSCPKAEFIVNDFLKSAIRQNVGLAAALIRLHFHDCFVQGCDGSILLDTTPTEKSEQEAGPNLTLRPAAFKAINDIRDRLEKTCGRVVSCADIVGLAARDSVRLASFRCKLMPLNGLLLPEKKQKGRSKHETYMSLSPHVDHGMDQQYADPFLGHGCRLSIILGGGPAYKVPLGRRDGLTPASKQAVEDALPPPTSKVPTLLSFLAKINLDVTDLVAFSGGHTVGIAHCGSFQNRLFPTQDPTLNKFFAGQLYLTCPVRDTDNITVNDIRTPNTFDNKYYVDLLNREGLFTSDQDLLTNATTRPIVTKFAVDQDAFFEQFVFSYVKMGQIQVLTGSQGQIRANCSARNDLRPWSVADAAESLLLL